MFSPFKNIKVTFSIFLTLDFIIVIIYIIFLTETQNDQ